MTDMLASVREWLVKHLHEAHGLPAEDASDDVFRASVADLKAAHDLLHASAEDAAKSEMVDDSHVT
jgi:hypothetical protein